MAAMVSPLHKVIDAARWDAECLLGRLLVLVHAAFLDACFVPLPLVSGRKRGPVPREAGRTASALSLRYAAPQLLHRQEDAEAAAALRLQVCGPKIVLYVRRDGWPAGATFWVLVDALAAAPLLSGGLDGTARALRRDATLAALWREISDRLCRRALVDLCRWNGVALEPSFMSLPGDVKAAILARLPDGADLARVEGTCTGLRRLVAERDRELWKPKYEAAWLTTMLPFPDAGVSPGMSWKQRYVRARRWQGIVRISFSWWRPTEEIRISPWWQAMEEIRIIPRYPDYLPTYDRLFDRFFGLFDRVVPPELPADPAKERKKRRAAARAKRAAGRGQAAPPRGQEKRRHGAGAIHAASSRYRWKHR